MEQVISEPRPCEPNTLGPILALSKGIHFMYGISMAAGVTSLLILYTM
jgi:hypothetical protein